MILVREVFRLKYGQMDKVLPALKEAIASQTSMSVDRILTDLSGQHFTLILERKVENLGDWHQEMLAAFSESDPEQSAAFSALIEHGYREIFTIEYES